MTRKAAEDQSDTEKLQEEEPRLWEDKARKDKEDILSLVIARSDMEKNAAH